MTAATLDDWWKRERLHFAAQDGDLQSVEQLLMAGLDVNAFDELAKTPLHYAAEKEHFAVVEFLLAHGADVNARHEPMIGNTPLGDIAGSCSYRMAELLIRAGADPRIEGWMRLTALDRAAPRKKEEGRRVYELLLRVSK